MKWLLLSTFVFLLSACSANKPVFNGDSAIKRVEDCVCYKGAEGQQLKPWELNWEDSEKLRKQFSHCICEAYIDLQNIENPKRYLVPGTVVK